jgi:endonuclease YncB( thermonuclease family)
MRTITLLLACALTTSAQAHRTHAQTKKPVVHVIDGDSLQIGSEEIRLWGIDAPEYNQTCNDNQQAGRTSRAFLVFLIDNKVPTCRAKGRDRYGRPLMICLNHQGSDLSRLMVEAGWAWAYAQYSQDYVGYEHQAMRAKLGVHGMKCELPWLWRQQHGRGGAPVPPLKK